MDEFGNPIGGDTATFDPNVGYTTAAPSVADGVNSAEPGFSAQTANPGATSYEDILRTGFSRLVDAVTSPAVITNTQPVQKKTTTVRNNTGAAPAIPATLASYIPWVLLLAGTLVAWKMLR